MAARSHKGHEEVLHRQGDTKAGDRRLSKTSACTEGGAVHSTGMVLAKAQKVQDARSC